MQRRAAWVWVALSVLVTAGCFGAPDAVTPTPPTESGPATWPAGLTFDVVASGLDDPVLVTHAGDGSGRLFIVEQVGLVHVLDTNGARATFLNVKDRIAAGGERGLLGLAFHPDFPTDGRVFVSYTDRDGASVLEAFMVRAGLVAPHAIVLRVPQPFSNHNGGHVAFGHDGYLYWGLGDGGSAGDPEDNGQDPSTLLGSLLRLDVDGATPYAVPADNPFADGEGGAPEVWAFGLRNPWRFSFDRATGDLFIGDVGQNKIEEIDYHAFGAPAGVNYGWNVLEGSARFRPGTPAGEAVAPVAEYDHAGKHCSVTGGHVYRGPDDALTGTYLFGDYCSGTVWGLRATSGTWESRELADTDHRISSFGEDEAGNLYVVHHGGSVLRVQAS